jgi:hypothetical protein
MKYAVEMGSGAMIHIPSLIETGSGIQNLYGGMHTHTHTHTGRISHRPTLGKKAKKSILNFSILVTLSHCRRHHKNRCYPGRA